MIYPSVNNEFSKLNKVVLGIADDFGGCPTIEQAYDPKSKEHIKKGTFPKEKDLVDELKSFLTIFNKYNVDVLRPHNIINCNQILYFILIFWGNILQYGVQVMGIHVIDTHLCLDGPDGR